MLTGDAWYSQAHSTHLAGWQLSVSLCSTFKVFFFFFPMWCMFGYKVIVGGGVSWG